MFIFHTISLFFLILLFFNAFSFDFAHDILESLIFHPKNKFIALILPVSLTISVIHFMYSMFSHYEEEVENIKSSIPSVKLSEDEKKKIDDAIEKAQKQSGDRNLEFDNLSSIIGLDNIKQQVNDLKHFIISQEKRKLLGLPTQNLNLHIVFTGNPGTGKTTVAREIAKIYKHFGLLKKGHLVETDRSGLVGEYVGQTAQKTMNVLENSIGGVLFIDEAYALVNGGQNDYGKEAIDTIIKFMEDKKGEFAVIVAGYPEEMKSFVDSNPGMKSRFGRFFNFDDYNHNELLQIFELFCKKEAYVLSDDARIKIANYIVKTAPIGEKGFGNGRYMRNIFEDTILKQSQRISMENIEDFDKMQLITENDLPF